MPTTLDITLAACAFELPSDNQGWLQVLPAGNFKPSDGRKMRVPHWRIDAQSAAALIDKFNARKTPPVIDYEHQTLYKEKNGQIAPAAGFIKALTWREGSGLWAKADYTDKARALIQSGEYRYFSPVFEHDAQGTVKTLLMGALTNDPAIDGMAALTASASRHLLSSTDKETTMTETIENDAKSVEQVAKTPDLSAIAQGLGLDAKADEAAILAACSALKTQAPDPAQYAPVTAMRELQSQLAALTAQIAQNEAETLVTQALSAGKLLPAQKEWALQYGQSDLNGLKTYLESASGIAALTKLQATEPPKDAHASGLTEEELQVARATGLTPAEFAAAKSERAGTAAQTNEKGA